MLYSLSISNFALINVLEVNFSEGLTILTGETGAGKSIMLGALSLLLGERADVNYLRDPNTNAVVEACFQVPAADHDLEQLLEDNGLDASQELIIRRVVYPTGKSRAFVNDQPANLPLLKQLGTLLIDIHSQHENLLLADKDYLLKVADAFAGLEPLTQQYKASHRETMALITRVQSLRAAYEKKQQDLEYLQYQYTELEQAQLIEGEQTELEQELKLLEHAAEIRQALYQIAYVLEEGQTPVLTDIRETVRLARSVAEHNPLYQQIGERLEEVRIELKDLAQECTGALQAVSDQPGKREQLSQRLDTLYTLERKHNVHTVEELLVLQESFEQQLQEVENDSTLLVTLEKQLETSTAERNRLADTLHKKRAEVLDKLSALLCSRLVLLGMPHAQLSFDLQTLPHYGPLGNSRLEVLFSANKDVAPKELSSIASGGEMSRLMLCVKWIMARSAGLSTIIFDEVDMGVSGKIADSMGDMIHELSEHMQVMAITHLPQVAAKGKTHYLVKKEMIGNTTQTNILKLCKEDRVLEIAGMLSGSVVTQAAMENARELLNKAL
ncbi:MAG: DNA repair protein RecN [Bacteroidales bacterium]|nr:DNA repair protein RecN [Bacteroidales bacterium]